MIAILFLARRMAEGSSPKEVRLDLVGTARSALGLGLIVFGILRSGTWGFVQPKPGAPEWLGLSPVIWLILGGGCVLWMFLAWEDVAGYPPSSSLPGRRRVPRPKRRCPPRE